MNFNFSAGWIPRSLLRMSSFRRMPESSGSFVDTGLRRCDVMLLIPRPLAAGYFIPYFPSSARDSSLITRHPLPLSRHLLFTRHSSRYLIISFDLSHFINPLQTNAYSYPPSETRPRSCSGDTGSISGIPTQSAIFHVQICVMPLSRAVAARYRSKIFILGADFTFDNCWSVPTVVTLGKITLKEAV